MQKRNMKLMILAITVTTFLSSNITVFAKSSQSEKSKATSSQNVGNGSKKTEKEILTLSHRLDSIEISLKNVIKNMDTYINAKPVTDTQSTDTQSTDTQSTDTQSTDTQSTDTQSTDTQSTDTQSTDTQSTDTQSTDTQSTDIQSTDTQRTDAQSTDSQTNTTTEDLSDDFENEYKEEDAGRYNSFYGKLNAINNRLNTIERQIGRISSSNNSSLTQLNDRLVKLREQVKTSMDNLTKVQKQNVEKVKSKSNIKKMEDQKISQDKKNWKIHFTKALKESTINSRNIMIVDSNNNVIDAQIAYDKKENNVVIQINDSFNKGETYSILIGEGVQSAEGISLPRPVEKKFTVN